MQEFFKIFIYLSFGLNIICGIWVFYGIFVWLAEIRESKRNKI